MRTRLGFPRAQEARRDSTLKSERNRVKEDVAHPESGALAAFLLVFRGGVGEVGMDSYFKQIMSLGNEESKNRLAIIVF